MAKSVAEARMPNMDVLAALAPPALRCIRASLPKNVAGDAGQDVPVSRRTGCPRATRMSKADGPVGDGNKDTSLRMLHEPMTFSMV